MSWSKTFTCRRVYGLICCLVCVNEKYKKKVSKSAHTHSILRLIGCVSRVGVCAVWWICDDARQPCQLDAEGSAWLRQSPPRCSPKNSAAPVEWKSNIFSCSLFSFVFRMHNPCLNTPRTTTLRVTWFEWGSETRVFLCVGSWHCSTRDWSIIHQGLAEPLSVAPLPLPDSFTLSVHGCNIHNSDRGDVFGLRTTCWLLLAN